MTMLFTIGYEKASPPRSWASWSGPKIDLLVDTRAVAASRRPGFSKRQLAAWLDEAGIGYIHLQKLGTPAKAAKPRVQATSRRSGASTTSTWKHAMRSRRSTN